MTRQSINPIRCRLVDPGCVTELLQSCGWVQARGRKHVDAIWTTEKDGVNYRVEQPRDFRADDYQDKLCELIEALCFVEGKEPSAVLEALVHQTVISDVDKLLGLKP